jgi:hypothetical protein
MAMVVESENTLTTIIGSEITLASPTLNAARVLRLDLGNLLAGDLVEIRLKSKVRTAGTVGDQYYMSYVGPVGNPIVETPPVSTDLGGTFTVRQVLGSVRTIDWKLLAFGSLVIESENTQAATISTKHTLLAPTTNKTRVLRVDLKNMAAGDCVALRVESKVRTAGTVRDQYYQTFMNALGLSIVETVPISLDLGGTFSLTQISGTGRSFDWKILTLD